MLFFKCGRKSSPAARAAAKNAHTLNNFFLRYPPRKKARRVSRCNGRFPRRSAEKDGEERRRKKESGERQGREAGKDRKAGRRKRGKRGAKRGQGGAHRFCKRVQLFCTGEAVFLCLAAQEANRRDFFEKSVDGGAGICYTNIRRRGNRRGRYHGKTHHRL